VLSRFGSLRPPGEGFAISVALERGAASVAPIVRALDEAGLLVAALELVEPTLDDVFVAKTGRHLEGSGGDAADADGDPSASAAGAVSAADHSAGAVAAGGAQPR
jgi:ABC-2 type transport system ATP-binding protein